METKRKLGLISATSLVIASMIGTGVFTTSGFLLRDLQNQWYVLLGWICGGIIAMLGALCYGSLARHIPKSGGEYRFLADLIHPAAGYIAGVISLLVGFSAPLALVAKGFGDYIRPWTGNINPLISGSVLISIFAVIHGIRTKPGAWFQNLIVFVKLAFILGFITYGAFHINWTVSKDLSGSFSLPVFAVSLVWISFSYSGWNAAVYIGGEIIKPEKNLPLALILATIIVTILYVGLNAIFIFSAPPQELMGKIEIAHIAAKYIGGEKLGLFVSLIIALALATSASSLTMAGPRVYAEAAEDGYLPSWFEEKGDSPPRASILLQTILALILLWTMQYEALLTYVGFTLSLCTAATVVGLIKLKLTKGAAVHVIGWPFVPITFIIVIVSIAGYTIYQQKTESLWGILTLVIGFTLWAVTPKRHKTYS